jgi:hypothetical protein
MKRRIIILLLIFTMLMIPAGVALASHAADTVVEAGDVIPNDIVLFDDNLEIQAGAIVNGDIVIYDGDANIAGTVRGDVVLFDGDLTVAETAVLSGECVLWNGVVTDNTTSGISCTNLDSLVPESVANFVNTLPDRPRFVPRVEEIRPSGWRIFTNGVAESAARSLLFGLLAFAVATLLPQHMARIEDTLRQKPVVSGTVGLLTFFAVPFLVLLLLPVSIILIFVCIGLLGFPLMAAMTIGLVAATALGWVTAGNVVGRRLANRLNLTNRSLPVTAALGTMVLTFVLGFLGAIPFVYGESVVVLAIMWVGLGATALTKFGTRAYTNLGTGAKVLLQEDPEKVTAVLETLPDDDNTLDE